MATLFLNLRTWVQGGYDLGQDMGKGLALALPHGLLDPFVDLAVARREQSKQYLLRHIILGSALLGKWILGPLGGVLLGTLALFPGLISSALYQQPFRLRDKEWAVRLTQDQSPKMIWSAIAMSALWGMLMMMGYLIIPPIQLLGITFAPWASALIFPMLTNYTMMALVGLGHGLIMLFKPIIFVKNRDSWQYALKGLVDIKIKDEGVKAHLHQEFQHELDLMFELFEAQTLALTDILHRIPTLSEVKRQGILSYYDLQSDQRQFLKTMTQSKMNTDDMNAAIDGRHRRYMKQYGASA